MTEEQKQRPKLKSSTEQQLDKAKEQFDTFDKEIKDLTLDRMNMAPKQEVDQQTKLSQSEIEKSKNIYLKPAKTIGSKEKFNEKFRDDYNFSKEYVQFIAENKECIGETTELWTKPYPGLPAEFWQVPSNKPVWGPRYLAERIKGCKHHRLIMDNRDMGGDGRTQFYGSMAVESVIQRLDAHPVNQRKSIFMGANNF